MFRLFIVLATISSAFCQNLPSFRWIQEVGGTGTDIFGALATDSQGNTYVVGATASPNFPVQSAVQSSLASSGLYRIDGPGSAYAALGLNSVTSIAIDPQNPNVLYAVSSGSGIKSVDGGNTWSSLSIPGSELGALVIDPFNDQNLYASNGTGVFNSANGGTSWSALNGAFSSGCGAVKMWADPNFQGVLFAFACGLYRSGDAGATWQSVAVAGPNVPVNLDFEPSPGVIFAITEGTYESTDDGVTFQKISAPTGISSVVPDPNQSSRLLAATGAGIYASTDTGATWTLVSPLTPLILVPAAGFLYAELTSNSIAQISSDLQTATPVGPAALPSINVLAYANGHLYAGVGGGHDVFVTKLEPSGNVVYSTYFGGNDDDLATAVAVDAAGGVYVTGTTKSYNFPTTNGAYLTSDPLPSQPIIFLFKLNPNGSLAYSTYFASATPGALAVDSAGSAYLTGTTSGPIPTTTGAYQTTFCCAQPPNFFFTVIQTEAFLTKFDPTGSTLIYSTYLGASGSGGSAVAVASDGSAYAAGPGVLQLNATGSALAASASPPGFIARAMAIGSDGSVYLGGGGENQFQPTAGAFQSAPNSPPISWTSIVLLPQGIEAPPGAIMKMDAQLQNVLASTFFDGPYGEIVQSIAVDGSSNVYAGGSTGPHGLPTRTELFEAFGPPAGTGFLAELSGDLSTLLFSSYLGDAQYFGVQGVALGSNGSVLIGGTAGTGAATSPTNVYVNSLALVPPPALRIDSVVNAASLLGGPVSAGEAVTIRGAGFGAQSQLMINDSPVPVISQAATQITAIVPGSVRLGAATVQVQFNGAVSNQVVVPVAASSPGIYSSDGSGVGEAYALNSNGEPISASNPASPGETITLYATGIGALSSTETSLNVYMGGYAANGTFLGASVTGIYSLTVIVPSLPANFPSPAQVLLQIDGVFSQNGLSIAIEQ